MKRKLEIITSPHAGYCFGVKRALRLIEQGLACFGPPIYTFGDVIHNPPEVERLRALGVRSVSSVDEVEEGGTLVLRAHGVHPAVIAEAERRGVRILDATCPFVNRSQNFVTQFSERSWPVIIIGDSAHPEVRGLAGHAGGRAMIVGSADEAAALPEMERAGVVIQTTFPRPEAERIIEVLSGRIRDLCVEDTICQATEARREATLDLAHRVDLMLIVGGRNSSNTMRLYQMCVDARVSARFVESPEEIDPAWFGSVRTVGIATGTSTPDWLIEAVVRRLNEISGTLDS
jgi:(E)-4-hydroxy-3-methyl-but-2-enyl pyrophosphate reductase